MLTARPAVNAQRATATDTFLTEILTYPRTRFSGYCKNYRRTAWFHLYKSTEAEKFLTVGSWPQVLDRNREVKIIYSTTSGQGVGYVNRPEILRLNRLAHYRFSVTLPRQ